MKSYDNYAQLELLSTHPTDSLLYPPTIKTVQPVSLKGRIAIAARQLGEACIRFLVGSSSPVIRQKRDRTGNVYFTVSDPITGISHRCSTEDEVREWLENRYHG